VADVGTGPGAQWSSRHGFLLATLGAAVGLGNIWRFSYVAGENGGGAFIVAYLIAVVALGWPLLVAELAIGRSTRTDAIGAFARIAPREPWRRVGWIGALASVVILTYYPVIAGWVANYLFRYISGPVVALAPGEHRAQFEGLIADPVQALGWFALVGVATFAIVAAGVERGIERACTWLMPAFIALLVGLTGYSLTLEGAGEAARFLFAPDWTALGRPQTYVAAIGQAFFSIGLGMGVLVTYGAYVPSHESLPRAALVLVLGDTLIALLAGMIVFPAVFTHGVDPAHGATLAFVALPEVFAVMPGGRWFAIAFFALLLIAALTSLVALLEVPVAVVVGRWGWQRSRAALVVGAAVMAIGVPVALGYGLLAPAQAGAPTLLDRLDYLASSVLLSASGIAVALVVGWVWQAQRARSAAGLAAAWGSVWHWNLRVFLPAVIAIASLSAL
jgi:neurotransmitter:Na+ symporter, NSS family